jgi:hypothetical protein
MRQSADLTISIADHRVEISRWRTGAIRLRIAFRVRVSGCTPTATPETARQHP